MNESNRDSSSENPTSKFILYVMPRFGSSVVLGIEGCALFTLYTVAYGVS